MMIDRTRRWRFDTGIDLDIDNYIGVGGKGSKGSGKGGLEWPWVGGI